MKAEYVNPFITSTINVFDTMTGLHPVKGDLYIKSDQNLHYDVSAVIGIVGDVVGYVSVSLPENLAMKIASIFLMEEKEEVDTDVGDAIGELINMIAGSTKNFSLIKVKNSVYPCPTLLQARGTLFNVRHTLYVSGSNSHLKINHL